MFDRDSPGHRLVAAVALACALCASARAATVTPKVRINFDGVLTELSYALGAGELDVTGTFQANGSPTITAGIADIPGDLDETSGFYFDKTSLGDLTTQNWAIETVMTLDVPPDTQPGQFNHFVDVQGDLFIRVTGSTDITEFGYWDGASEPRMTTTDLDLDSYSHVALTWDAGTSTLEAFINGVTQGTVSTGAPFEVLDRTFVGYGFFARFLNRAIDGKLDSAAFSTFTGTFNAPADFQLPLPPAALFGDYDDDKDVDGADFLAWQRALGGATPLPNDQTPDSVGADDLAVWKTNFGTTTGVAATAAVPEPAAVSLLLAGLTLAPSMLRRARVRKDAASHIRCRRHEGTLPRSI